MFKNHLKDVLLVMLLVEFNLSRLKATVITRSNNCKVTKTLGNQRFQGFLWSGCRDSDPGPLEPHSKTNCLFTRLTADDVISALLVEMLFLLDAGGNIQQVIHVG